MEKFFSYEKSRKALKDKAELLDAAIMLDIDGVVDDVKTLKFEELPVNALAALQGAFRETVLVTGRYANLFVNEGISKFNEYGFDFSKPFRCFAEMGGVELCLVDEAETYKPNTRIITDDRDRMFRIAEDINQIDIDLGDKKLCWIAKLHAPEITEEARYIVWQATKDLIAEQIKAGNLEEFGIGSDADVELWVPRIYNRELENLTKGTITTSRIEKGYEDLAVAVNAKIGGLITERINIALEDYNKDQPKKLVAEFHSGAGCIEVLFEGINKFNAAQQAIEVMDQKAGHIITFGDNYSDIKLSQAAVKCGRTALHFHVGNANDFAGQLNREGALRPSVAFSFPEYDYMSINNPSTASVIISSFVFWRLAQKIDECLNDSIINTNIENIWGNIVSKFGGRPHRADYHTIG